MRLTTRFSSAESTTVGRPTRGGFPTWLLMPEQSEHCEDATIGVFAVREVELLKDALYRSLDRTRAEIQLLGDRPVRAALGDQGQHRAFALGEVVQDRASMAGDE